MRHVVREGAPAFIPAAGVDALAPIYDTFVALTMPERRIKESVLREAAPKPGHVVLDVGCGTGTLLLWAQRLYPDATFIGVDPDPKILGIATRKAARRGATLLLERAMAGALPHADASVDRVVTTFAVHHLTTEDKLVFFREARRVLRPDGLFVVADFGPPHSGLMRVLSRLLAVADGAETVADNVGGRVPHLMRDAGFAEVTDRAHFGTPFGSAWIWAGHAR